MKAFFLIVLSFVVACNVYAQSPKEPLRHPNQAKEDSTPDKRGTEQAPFIVKTIPTPKTEAETAADAQDKEEKAANDRQLVYWTRALVGVGVVQFLVLVVQAFVFGFQARRLRETVDEMKLATDASEKTSAATLARQRAFVAFISLKLAIVQDLKTKRVTLWRFAPIWENTGDTPTRGMTAHVSLMAFEGGLPNDWDFPDIWSQSDDRTRVPLGISPHHSIFGSPIYVSIETIDEIVARKRSLYVWGWASYSDIFPNTEKHITRFAVQVTVDGNPRNIDQCSVDYPFAAKYNCSDEECTYQGYPVSRTARPLIPGA